MHSDFLGLSASYPLGVVDSFVGCLIGASAVDRFELQIERAVGVFAAMRGVLVVILREARTDARDDLPKRETARSV